MKTVTLPARTLDDAIHGKITVKFPRGSYYAVVADRRYTTHRTGQAAIKQYLRGKGGSPLIVDDEGIVLTVKHDKDHGYLLLEQ